jgi:acyl-CoA thioesterase
VKATPPGDYAEFVRDWNAQHSPLVDLMGYRLESVERGKATLRLPYRPEIANRPGTVHGGAIAGLCDAAMYIALASIYGREQDTTTVQLSCNFLAPALPPHDLLARAEVLRAGRRIVYGEVKVYSNERLVAHATLNFLNTNRE